MTVKLQLRPVKSERKGNRILKKSATTKAIVDALKDSNWPFTPFNQVPAINAMLVYPETHKQSPFIAKRALEALKDSDTPEKFATKVRGIK